MRGCRGEWGSDGRTEGNQGIGGGGEWRWERAGGGETREQWLRGPVAEGAREAGPADGLSVPFSAAEQREGALFTF